MRQCRRGGTTESHDGSVPPPPTHASPTFDRLNISDAITSAWKEGSLGRVAEHTLRQKAGLRYFCGVLQGRQGARSEWVGVKSSLRADEGVLDCHSMDDIMPWMHL